MAKTEEKEEDAVLDNEIIVIDKTRIIMKIDKGWFLLTKDLS